jgi:bile acid:Na+ symporter, BASS family
VTTTTRLKLLAYALFALGFLIPFGASDWKGAPLTAHPGAVAATAVLWIAGMLLEYRAYTLERADAGLPLWRRLCDFVGRSAATWLLLGIAFGFVYYPTVSTTFFGTNFNAVLAITLAVMGIQITLDAWRQLIRNVRPVITVVLLRWIIMPLVGYCVAYAVFTPFLSEATAHQLAIGMILLATSPTGAASNSLTLISKGDLALSVSATTLNVLIAPFLQPVLVKLFAGSATSVDASGMFLELVKYVLAPVVVATIVGILFPRLVERIKPVLPAIAVLSLACVLMGTVSKGTATILSNPGVIGFVIAACVIHGLIGLTLGYVVPKYLGFSRPQRVASSFEVGIENAAIAPALAISYFGPLAIIPAVVYGKTQNLLAVTLFAPYFRKQAEQAAQVERVDAPTRAPAANGRVAPVPGGGELG